MTRNLDSVGLAGEPGHPRRWAALAVMMVCLVVVSLDNTILNVALKTIQQDLGATGADMQWTVNSYTLAF
ncbi:MAG TPA: MFS transporter, partial [Dermatophilaceae bacterium]